MIVTIVRVWRRRPLKERDYVIKKVKEGLRVVRKLDPTDTSGEVSGLIRVV